MPSSNASWLRQTAFYTLAFAFGGITAMVLSEAVKRSDKSPYLLPHLPTINSQEHALSVVLLTVVALAAVLSFAPFILRKFGNWVRMTVAKAAVAIAPEDHRLNTLSAVRGSLEKQLADLVRLIGRHLEATEVQSDAFENAEKKLQSADTAQQVLTIIDALLAASVEGRRETEQLRAQLKTAQAQTATLRQRLTYVQKLASLDPLTSLPNRRTFDRLLEDAVETAHAEHTPLSVVMADIDNFKRINDTFGHPTGDAVLKQFANVMLSSIRASDVAARYGGEEFAVVLQMTSIGNAADVAKRIRSEINAASWRDENTNRPIGQLTASFGVAEILEGETREALIKRVDRSLYLAKANGRDRIERDDEAQIQALTKR